MRIKPKDVSWSFYWNHALGWRISRIGEKTGLDSLIYNPFMFRAFHEFALMNAPGVIKSLKDTFQNVRRYVDVGAGSGAFAAEAMQQGLQVVACEHNKSGRRIAHQHAVDCHPFDLTLPVPADLRGPFDLAYCFEVAEHLPEELGMKLIDFLAAQAPCVVFSAAHPGQGGTGHINEQPKPYWIVAFEQRQMTYSQNLTEEVLTNFRKNKVPSSWFFENLMIFHKTDCQSG